MPWQASWHVTRALASALVRIPAIVPRVPPCGWVSTRPAWAPLLLTPASPASPAPPASAHARLPHMVMWCAQLSSKLGMKGLHFVAGGLPSWLNYTEKEKVTVRGLAACAGGAVLHVPGKCWRGKGSPSLASSAS